MYQDIVSAYRTADRDEGKKLLRRIIDALTTNLPTGLVELRRLGRTLKRRAADVLAFFTRPGTSNGPTEAINGRLQHPRGSAVGFRSLTLYIARCLLESGGFRRFYTLSYDDPVLAQAASVSFSVRAKM